ncbi:right-handed parallel beta-helix repeat-containing protein [Methanobrevibacter sp.]|uniref:right-handed parallel beta-helix repeat-containing protein n=1 Tax=Methanobrevibacter sp. TaxID=66852 RepID=UPI00386EDB91
MNQKKLTLILAMLVLAVFAVGAVSAADNVTADIDEPASDIVIDDVPAVETDESEPADLDAAEDSNSGTRGPTINVVNYSPSITYCTKVIVQNNTIYNGNGATIYGTGSDDVFVVDNAENFTITGFNIIVNSTSKIGIHGANIKNATISNNNITGGKDGINIKQTYDKVTITNNNIAGVVRDAISLVDHSTLSDTAWANRPCSIISNNVITGPSEYGVFIGGNFKGEISNNVVTDVDVGFEFAGKKAATNGRLCVLFNNNTINNVGNGINMYHPNVICFNLTNSNIYADDYAIYTNSNFVASGYVGVYNSNFTGTVSSAFKTAAGNNTANNTGF